MGRSTTMKHILVVEDEEHLAIGIKYNFEAEGYRVTTVGDGASALKLLNDQANGIDLVILDLMLPGMSGYAVCEALREAGNHVPILMLSARTLAEDRIRGFDSGTDQYMEKPFDLDELLSRARNLLHRQGRSSAVAPNRLAGDTFEFGTAKVNFDTYEVTAQGRPLRLTNMEMKLLQYFIEHEGSVVTRGQLLENVWGLSTSVTTRTVDNFIVRLRKYFEQDPARPQHFLSVRGAGYRFVAKEKE
jgi:two-component system, OmpR family, alkaline phosphatase synthesis response regulator PhoP